MLDHIGTGSRTKDLPTKIIRISNLDINSVCIRIISGSSGLRFCTRTRCSTTSHKQQKIVLDRKIIRYYILRLCGGQAFMEPHVLVNLINPKEQQALKSVEKSLAVWRFVLKLLDAIYTSRNEACNVKDGEAIFDATKELLNINTARENLKTPKTKQYYKAHSNIMESAVEIQTNFLPKQQKLVQFKDNIEM